MWFIDQLITGGPTGPTLWQSPPVLNALLSDVMNLKMQNIINLWYIPIRKVSPKLTIWRYVAFHLRFSDLQIVFAHTSFICSLDGIHSISC